MMKQKLIIILSLALILSGCGPAFYLRKSERNLKKAIAKGAIITADTVYIEKQIFVPEVKTDTIFESQQGDTVVIQKDRLKIKYVNLPGEKVYIEGECAADTVYIKTPVAVTKTIKAGKSIWNYTHWFAILFFFGCVVGFFIRQMLR
jgi:hypothetical protein